MEQQNRIKDLKIQQEERIQSEQKREIELLERQKQLDKLKIEKQETARKTLLGAIALVITVADCTGHGVPGAFMSMLGMSLLKEIIVKEYITHPGVILRKLRKEIINVLNQKGRSGEQRDGMDMALISMEKDTCNIQFAGAYNPLYVLRENNKKVSSQLNEYVSMKGESHTLFEIKGNKLPIAIYEKMDRFKNYEIKLNKGDQLYMFSDGFADQFGGPKLKKFKYKQFKELILNFAGESMDEQKKVLDKTFDEWKGEMEQIDDVCILGLKI